MLILFTYFARIISRISSESYMHVQFSQILLKVQGIRCTMTIRDENVGKTVFHRHSRISSTTIRRSLFNLH